MAAAVHFYGHVYGLEQAVLVYAGKDEIAFVKRFGALGGGADAHGGYGLAHREEEAAFLWERAGVAHYGE